MVTYPDEKKKTSGEKNNTDIVFIKEVVQNLPEYSVSMRCTGWNYDECIFNFVDDEDGGKKYTVNLPMLIKGYKKLKELWINQKAFFDGINTEMDWRDAGCWDCWVVDALIQCSVFNDIIYG